MRCCSRNFISRCVFGPHDFPAFFHYFVVLYVAYARSSRVTYCILPALAQRIFSSCRDIPEGEQYQIPNLQRIRIPATFCFDGDNDGSYALLFRHCLLCDVVPLGLYRQTSRKCTADRGYIYTNPPDDAKIQLGDDLFVIAPPHYSFSGARTCQGSQSEESS